MHKMICGQIRSVTKKSYLDNREKTEEAARYPSVSTESVMTLMRSKQKHSYERNAHFLDFVMILNTFNCQS